MVKFKNIPIFVAHKGCPNNCVFCDQKKISGAKDEIDEEALRKMLSKAVEGCDASKTQIAFFGGSFTGIDRAVMEKYLSVAYEYIEKYGLNGIRLSTRPDYIDGGILGILKKYGVKTIELGVQSMDDRVLRLNERNMTADTIKKACFMIKEAGFELGVQLMTSMYGSDYEADILSARKAAELMPDFVRIYPTVVIPGTKLFLLYESGEYQTKTLEETVKLSEEMLEIFIEKNIEVIRIGLMTNEDINCEKVIGAYHPAFGELVFGEYYYKKLVSLITKEIKEETKEKILVVKCPCELVSKISGHKKRNIQRLKEKFAFYDIKFSYRADNDIKLEIIEGKKRK